MDLPENLRAWVLSGDSVPGPFVKDVLEAAREIERLRAALKPFAEMAERLSDDLPDAVPIASCFANPGDRPNVGDLRQAARSLSAPD
jgi:hypothetical protein